MSTMVKNCGRLTHKQNLLDPPIVSRSWDYSISPFLVNLLIFEATSLTHGIGLLRSESTTEWRTKEMYSHFENLGGGQEVGRSCHVIQFKGKCVMVSKTLLKSKC